VSFQQREILSYFDREDAVADGEGEVIGKEGFGERDIRKLGAGLEKAIQVNEARRSKFVDDPTKYALLRWGTDVRYIDSEADLFTAIASFTFLSEHSKLYPVFVKVGAMEKLMRLFAHENIDIAISVLEVLVELTGEDVEFNDESDMQVLVDEMFKDDAMELVIANLERLDESKDDDRQGVFHTLSAHAARPC
jgi:beta-catenin-like protein 1